MMKNIFRGLSTAIALILLAGCASHPASKPVATKAIKAESPETKAILQSAAAKPPADFTGTGWKSLFDGRTLKGWKVTDFYGHAGVRCESGMMVAEAGETLSGVNWTKPVLKMNYEVALEAMRVEGGDFFCALTFPVGETNCSLIIGGWGGTVTGLSSIDGQDASQNETTDYRKFEQGRWYRIRLRVTETMIEAWVDDDRIVNFMTTGKNIGLRFGDIELSRPLGLASYETMAAWRNIKVRKIEGGGEK